MPRYFLPFWLLAATSVLAFAGKNLADYPLRIHVFGRNETTFYHMRAPEEAKGEGRANLFENGEARGVDFQFDCSKRLMASSAYETYPARWKRPNEQLEVLIPEFGKANGYSTCTFRVQMKDFAYFRRNGMLESEPIAAYKEWMVKHDYDPEHGKNTPTPTAPGGSQTGSSPKSDPE